MDGAGGTAQRHRALTDAGKAGGAGVQGAWGRGEWGRGKAGASRKEATRTGASEEVWDLTKFTLCKHEKCW